MAQEHIKEHGHVLLAAVIGVAVVVVGIGVWQYVQSSRDEQESTPNQQISSKEDASETSAEPEIADPSEGGKYLVITEWGVRIPLPAELQGDVKYGMFSFDSGEKTAYMTSIKVAERNPGGPCDFASSNDSGQGLSGGLVAMTQLDTEPEEYRPSNFYSEKTGHWYVMGYGKVVCYAGDTGQESGQFSLLMDDAARLIEPIK